MGLSDPGGFARSALREFAVGFVDEILDVLALRTAVLVGASGGGLYATWYALEHPHRVRGLVMLGSTPTLPGGHLPLPIRMMATPILGDLLAGPLKPGRRALLRMMATMGEADTITRHPDLLEALVMGAGDRVAVAANLAELRALASPLGFRAAMRVRRDDLRRISVPTLMILGDRDPVLPIAAGRAAARMIRWARIEVLPGGHVPQLGHPRRVAELVAAFAATCSAPAAPGAAPNRTDRQTDEDHE
jgi:pimeloyl-ACP methyl ester carboxylesterase